MSRHACHALGWALVAAVSIGAAGASRANDYGYYNSDNDLLWGITQMPDFDQKRSFLVGIPGLPGDGGMYCVPTSTMNMFAYVARHGYPSMAPGIADWESANLGVYNDATGYLDALGSLMGTGASSGTGSTGWYFGTHLWLMAFGGGQFDHYMRLAKNGQNVTTRRMAKTGLNGGLVVCTYGRWNHAGIFLTSRASGHCITPIRVDTTGGLTSELWYRDPATGGSSETSQSGFSTTTVQMIDEVFIAYGVPMILSRMDLQPPPSDGRYRIIDKYYTVFPKQGLTDFPPFTLELFTPHVLGFLQASSLRIPVSGEVLAIEQAPSRNFWAYLAAEAGADPGLFQVDPLSKEVRRVEGLASPNGLVFGRDERCYVVELDRIRCYKPNDDDELGIEAFFEIPAPHVGGAIAFDDDTDEVIVLSHETRSMMRFRTPGVPPLVQPLPETVPLTGIGGLEWDPATGDLFLIGGGRLHQIKTDPFSGRLVLGDTFVPPTGSELRSFSIDSDGHLFLNIDGVVREMVHTATGGYRDVEDSDFNGMRCGNVLAMSTSRTNFDPELHSDPGWNTNIIAEEALVGRTAVDCPADWDVDGDADVFDLLAYLSVWFDAGFDADLDFNGGVDVFDLLVFLELWFAGC